MTPDPRPGRRQLRAVPEPGGLSATTLPRAGSTNHQDNHTEHGTTDQERNAMDATGTTPTDNGNERDDRPGAVLGRWLRRVFVEPWNEVVCAVVGLTLDVVVVLVCVHYIRNEVIPTWLDAHGGHWAWLGCGAFAAVLLRELFDNLNRLHYAVWKALDRRHMRAITDRLAAASLDNAAGESSGGERR